MDKEHKLPDAEVVVEMGKRQPDEKDFQDLRSEGGSEDAGKGMLHSNDREGCNSAQGELVVGMHTCMGYHSQVLEPEPAIDHRAQRPARARTTLGIWKMTEMELSNHENYLTR
jgi:hypothetical protein